MQLLIHLSNFWQLKFQVLLYCEVITWQILDLIPKLSNSYLIYHHIKFEFGIILCRIHLKFCICLSQM